MSVAKDEEDDSEAFLFFFYSLSLCVLFILYIYDIFEITADAASVAYADDMSLFFMVRMVTVL